MDLTPTRVVEGRDDQSWLGSAYGTGHAQNVTLDVTKFTAATHYPNGYFPSGIAVAKNAANSYVPVTDGATDGTQNLAGYIFTATAAPRSATTTTVQAALLDHGRIRTGRLPIPVSAAAQGTNPRFIYV